MADKRYLRFNSDFRPSHSAVADVVEDQLDRAADSLRNARRLGGQASGIPSWDMLMVAWKAYCGNNNASNGGTSTARASDSDADTVDGTRRRWNGSRRFPISYSDQTAAWAYSLTRDELFRHPVVQAALERGVVEVGRTAVSSAAPAHNWQPDASGDRRRGEGSTAQDAQDQKEATHDEAMAQVDVATVTNTEKLEYSKHRADRVTRSAVRSAKQLPKEAKDDEDLALGDMSKLTRDRKMEFLLDKAAFMLRPQAPRHPVCTERPDGDAAAAEMMDKPIPTWAELKKPDAGWRERNRNGQVLGSGLVLPANWFVENILGDDSPPREQITAADLIFWDIEKEGMKAFEFAPGNGGPRSG